MTGSSTKPKTFARGVGYVRVSTAGQSDNVSTEVQQKKIREWMEERDVEVVEIIEVDESGRYLIRDGLNRIRELAKLRAIDVLVAYDQDRAFRSEYVRRKVEEEDLLPYDVEMRFVFEPEGLPDKDRKYLRGLKGVQAEYYSDFIRERVTEAMLYKAMNGEFCGGNLPYGYTTEAVGERKNRQGKVKPIRHLAPHPEESVVVRFMKELYAYGASDAFEIPVEYLSYADFGMGTIAAILNKLGIRTRVGREWTKETVGRLLRDPHDRHLGTYTYNKTYGSKDERRRRNRTAKDEAEFVRVPHCYPAIVDEATQIRCQEKAAANRRRSPRSFASEYLLTDRMLHCPCRSPMSGFTRTPQGKHKAVRRSYMCSRRRNSKTCPQPTIKAESVEEAVVGSVLGYLRDTRVQDRILAYARGRLDDKSEDKAKAIEAVRHRILDIDRQVGNVREHLRQAPDLGEVLYDDLRDLMAQKKDAEAHLRRLRMGHDPDERKRHLDAVERMVTGVDALWEAASLEERKTILKGFVKRADLSADGGKVTIQIRVPVLFGELAEVVEVEVTKSGR